MDWQAIIQTTFGFLLLAFGWFAREVWSAVQQLKSELNILRVDIGTNYVRYDRLQDALRPIATTLQRIEDALASKVDKT